MASAKIVLHRNLNKDGTRAVCLRIIHNRQTKYKALGRTCLDSYFNASAGRFTKSFPEYRAENNLLLTIEQRAADVIREFERIGAAFMASDVIDKLYPKGSKDNANTVVGAIENARLHFEERGQVANSILYKDLIPLVSAFDALRSLASVTSTWIIEFEHFLRVQRNHKDGGVYVLLRTLRAVFNREIKARRMTKDWYPFAEISLAHLKGKKKNKALSLDDLRTLEKAEVRDFNEDLAKDLFFFSFYCQGMNLADIAEIKPRQIVNGRLRYNRKKTGAEFNMQLLPEALSIIEKYAGTSLGYCFPIYDISKHKTEMQRLDRKKRVTKIVNRSIRSLAVRSGIEHDELIFYSARHTYANLMRVSGVNHLLIKDALGHTKFSTTEGYLASFDNSDVDEANLVLRGIVKG